MVSNPDPPGRIVVVDDDPTVADVVGRYLVRDGHTVECVHDGYEALRRVAEEPPDLVVEIVSPEQSTNALVRRCLWYVANGVGIALLVDPSDRSVILFRPGSTPIGLSGEDRIDLGDLLPGLELTVQQLFDTLKVR